ncbi:MAG TPA: Uma2 family endonuclease [Tepidisphaeraceae bacterium]|nr:Uma2 family endonuclease [Tepidisphaeraceae bacterium]
MSSASIKPHPAMPTAEPAWDIARLFPNQGHWTVDEYLRLNGNYFVEFTNGYIEVLSMPTQFHQLIVRFIFRLLLAYVDRTQAGEPLFAPLRVRLAQGKYREPDIVFMLVANAHRRHNEFWEGADLVMEVVSDDDRRRDLELKRFEYARAGIPEYWIVDPQLRQITVLTLSGGEQYTEHGIFPAGERATSVILPGFEVPVTETFDVK